MIVQRVVAIVLLGGFLIGSAGAIGATERHEGGVVAKFASAEPAVLYAFRMAWPSKYTG